MIKLRRIYSDPFVEHPSLLEIWPEYEFQLRLDVDEALNSPSTDAMHLIVDDDEVVGLTGFYQHGDQVGLNWHGVLSSNRGCGYATVALQLLIAEVLKQFPTATVLIESMPLFDVERRGPFFVKAGFVQTDKVILEPWVPNGELWTEWHLNLITTGAKP